MKKRNRSFVVVSMAILMALTAVDVEFAGAASVPSITIDASSCSVSNTSQAYVSGSVSPAVGQIVRLLSSDRSEVLGMVRVTGNGGRAAFRIRVPEHVLRNRRSVTLYIRSNSAGYVSASGYVAVRITVGNAGGSSTVTVPKTTTKTKTTDPGKNKAKKTVKKTKPKTAAEGRAAAVAWARKIAADNSFTYGATPYSQHNGCYYCGTNGGKKRRARGTKWANGYKGKKWNKTYCCNPFVHACYAHGAQHPTMLKYCRGMNAIDMSKASYRKMGCFKCLGKPKFSKLIAGDIFVGSNHVWMYCGKGEMVEATSLGGGKKSWSAASIRVSKNAKKKYSKCRFVMRFTGY